MRELKPCPFCGDLEKTNDTGRVFYKELPHDARFLTTLDDAHLQIAQDNNGWVLHFEDDCGDRMFDIKISCCPICGRNLDSCANGWIPVTLEYDAERGKDILKGPLPDDEQSILATDGKSVWEDVFLRDGEECYLDSGSALASEVIAWQPLPEPYKGEN